MILKGILKDQVVALCLLSHTAKGLASEFAHLTAITFILTWSWKH